MEQRWILLPLNFSRRRFAHESRSKMSELFSRLKSHNASSREIWPLFKIRSPSRAICDRGFASTSFTIMVDRLAPQAINASGDLLAPAPGANRPAGNARHQERS